MRNVLLLEVSSFSILCWAGDVFNFNIPCRLDSNVPHEARPKRPVAWRTPLWRIPLWYWNVVPRKLTMPRNHSTWLELRPWFLKLLHCFVLVVSTCSHSSNKSPCPFHVFFLAARTAQSWSIFDQAQFRATILETSGCNVVVPTHQPTTACIHAPISWRMPASRHFCPNWLLPRLGMNLRKWYMILFNQTTKRSIRFLSPLMDLDAQTNTALGMWLCICVVLVNPCPILHPCAAAQFASWAAPATCGILACNGNVGCSCFRESKPTILFSDRV